MGGDIPPCCEFLLVGGFNPRPRMGGDYEWMLTNRIKNCFNPRPRMGGDDFLDLRRLPANSFNPRPRMGGDLNTYGKLGLSWFQSTPPHGGRHYDVI